MIRWSVLALFALLPISFACNGPHDASAPPASATIATVTAPTGAALSGITATPAAAAAAAETVIHAEDDGKSYDVARGSLVTFSLPSHAGTGYIWVPTQVDSSVLAQQGDRTSDAASDVPGAPKVDVYHFAAAAPGTTTVEMSLKRPFGSGVPARSVHVVVAVH
jgi:predicted secreted protein